MKQEEIPVTKSIPHKTKQPTTKRRPRSESSSNASDSNSGEDIMEEGEYDGKDHRKDGPSGSAKDTKTEPSSTRLSLSERFGKLAQLSSQRRNLDQLVQLKIVTPVTGAGPGEKNVSVDETSAAPVIPGLRAAVMSNRLMELIPRQPTVPQHHPLPAMTNMQPPEEIIPHLMKDDRAREEVDKWRDWHDRYCSSGCPFKKKRAFKLNLILHLDTANTDESDLLVAVLATGTISECATSITRTRASLATI